MKHPSTRTPTSLLHAIDQRLPKLSLWASAFVLCCAGSLGCSSNDSSGYATINPAGGANGANGVNGANGSAVTGAGTDASGSGTSGLQPSSGATTMGLGTSGGVGGTGGFEECAGTISEGEALALDMFIVLDHTTSMTDNEDDCPLVVGQTPSQNNKWCYATHALASFFVGNTAPGARAALNFMAMPGYVCEGGPNNPQAQAQVPLTPLPADPAGPLVAALEADGPFGVQDGNASTAIEAALRGMNDYTLANRTAGRKMIGILITDGDPTVCDQNIDNLAQLVADQLSVNGLETYIIGMTGATESNLQALAVGGGAPEHASYCGSMASCHFWSVGDGDPAAFVDALNQIQAAALLPCSYQIPSPPAGEVIDHNLVNAQFTTFDGQQVAMTRVDSAVGCTPGAYQWYYDNLAAPTSLELCPDACTVATEQGEGSSVKVAYGCATAVDIK